MKHVFFALLLAASVQLTAAASVCEIRSDYSELDKAMEGLNKAQGCAEFVAENATQLEREAIAKVVEKIHSVKTVEFANHVLQELEEVLNKVQATGPTATPTPRPIASDIPTYPSPHPSATAEGEPDNGDGGIGQPTNPLRPQYHPPATNAVRSEVEVKLADVHAQIMMSSDPRKWIEPHYDGAGMFPILQNYAAGRMGTPELRRMIGSYVLSYGKSPPKGDDVPCSASRVLGGNLVFQDQMPMTSFFFNFMQPGCIKTYLTQGELIGARIISDGGLIRLNRTMWPGTTEYSMVWFDKEATTNPELKNVNLESLATHIFVGKEFTADQARLLHNLISTDSDAVAAKLVPSGRYVAKIISSVGGNGKERYYRFTVTLMPR